MTQNPFLCTTPEAGNAQLHQNFEKSRFGERSWEYHFSDYQAITWIITHVFSMFSMFSMFSHGFQVSGLQLKACSSDLPGWEAGLRTETGQVRQVRQIFEGNWTQGISRYWFIWFGSLSLWPSTNLEVDDCELFQFNCWQHGPRLALWQRSRQVWAPKRNSQLLSLERYHRT